MKVSLSVGAVAVAIVVALAQPGYSQTFMAPGAFGLGGGRAGSAPGYPPGYGYSPASGPVVGGPVAGAPIVGQGFGAAPVQQAGYYDAYDDPHAGGSLQEHYGGEMILGDHADCDQCAGLGCDCCQPARRPRFWGGLEVLALWRRARTLPVLLVTNPTGTPIDQVGILPPTGGPNSTEILVGGDVGGERPHLGARYYGGMWLDELHEVAITTNVWMLEDEPVAYFFQSDGSPGSQILAQPFRSILTQDPSRPILAFPGFSRGSIQIVEKNQNVAGGDILLRTNWDRGEWYSLDLLGGFMASRMDDNLTTFARRTSIPPNGPAPLGSMLNYAETFDTKNTFYAGALGISTQLISDSQRFYLHLSGKLGFGNMNQRLRVRGQTVSSVPGAGAVVSPGGLFAQPTNIGDFSQNRFAFAPAIDARMTYLITRHFGITFGYNFMYWTTVMEAGDQIDTTVNETNFGGIVFQGPKRPKNFFPTTDFWLQGITLGFAGQF